MDFFGTFVGLIDDYLIAPLGRQINYLRRSSVNVNDMQTAVRQLMARKDDKQSNLKNSGLVETKEASNWFNDVEAIKNEADAIEVEYNQGGWGVNYRSSKRSIDLKRKAEDCLNPQFQFFRQPSPKRVRQIESEPIENQPSTLGMLEKILGCIDDPKFGIIGVYGMGGVGKTTLAKQVNNHFSNNSCFETVIMVTVSATPDIRSIQTTIRKRLGLDLSNTTEDDAREKLYDALKRKKFLLILDDVWDKHIVKLEDVGIPHPRSHKGSKILITSRSQDACTDMGARETIKVQPLLKVESWNLFVEKVGDHVATDGIRCFAEKIVERCEGLPLAIVTVAQAMANRRTVEEWANAEREMKESITDVRGMKDKVLVLLKFSFDRLEDGMLRSLFLYCGCCFPEDHNIWPEQILDYCVGEGLVDRLGNLIATRNKSKALIGSLKIACMLEDGASEGSVRMHDVMRELALWITSTSEFDGSPKFLLRTGQSCKEAPQPKEWVDATGVSLFGTPIKELPQLGERCQNLTTLLLRNNWALTVPPTNFLQHMDHLTTLDLSGSYQLEYLPNSLSCLENLGVLRLTNCWNLKALPTLGRLRQLQVLDLFRCYNLDQQIFGSECMGVASNLRYLNVSHSKVSIPTGVISCLVKVEELSLDKAKNIKWSMKAKNEINEERSGGLLSDSEDHDQQPSSSSINQSIIDVGELSNLTCLTSLSISLDGIIISDWFKPLATKIKSSSLKHCRLAKPDAIQALKESQCLYRLEIENCTGLTCVPTLLKENLMIKKCKELEKLLDGAEAYQDSFQKLKFLHLESLPKMERICVGRAPQNCFAQLSSLCIRGCNRLKMVFTKEMPRLFNNLSSMSVHYCDELEVIIEAEEEEEDERGIVMEGNNNGIAISPFPKLKFLWLQNLPALADVCNNHILHCPLLEKEKVILSKCPRLNKKGSFHISNTDGLLVPEGGRWNVNNIVMQEQIPDILKGRNLEMKEVLDDSYWCYECGRSVNAVMEVGIQCLICGSGFLEEMG